jgi:hypothetical protein
VVIEALGVPRLDLRAWLGLVFCTKLRSRLMRPLLAANAPSAPPGYATPWQPSTATCAATSMTRAWETLPELKINVKVRDT